MGLVSALVTAKHAAAALRAAVTREADASLSAVPAVTLFPQTLRPWRSHSRRPRSCSKYSPRSFINASLVNDAGQKHNIIQPLWNVECAREMTAVTQTGSIIIPASGHIVLSAGASSPRDGSFIRLTRPRPLPASSTM